MKSGRRRVLCIGLVFTVVTKLADCRLFFHSQSDWKAEETGVNSHPRTSNSCNNCLLWGDEKCRQSAWRGIHMRAICTEMTEILISYSDVLNVAGLVENKKCSLLIQIHSTASPPLYHLWLIWIWHRNKTLPDMEILFNENMKQA